MSKQELETVLEIALHQRKEAYALRCPRVFITHLNNQIRTARAALAEVAK